MNDRQQRILESHCRAIELLRDCVSALGVEAPRIVERIEQTIAEIKTLESQQYVGRTKGQMTVLRRQLEKVRNDQMLPLARLARRVFVGETALEAALRVPHKRAPSEKLLTAGARIATALRPHRALLAASHIDPSRLVRLQRDVRDLKKAFHAAHGSTADRAVPTRRMRTLFASANMDMLALDALVGASAGGPSMDFWKGIRRIHKRMGRPRAKRKPAGDQTADQAADQTVV
jgi:hypothetical protein